MITDFGHDQNDALNEKKLAISQIQLQLLSEFHPPSLPAECAVAEDELRGEHRRLQQHKVAGEQARPVLTHIHPFGYPSTQLAVNRNVLEAGGRAEHLKKQETLE